LFALKLARRCLSFSTSLRFEVLRSWFCIPGTIYNQVLLVSTARILPGALLLTGILLLTHSFEYVSFFPDEKHQAERYKQKARFMGPIARDSQRITQHYKPLHAFEGKKVKNNLKAGRR
jgi:hypothetical protein